MDLNFGRLDSRTHSVITVSSEKADSKPRIRISLVTSESILFLITFSQLPKVSKSQW